MVSLVLLTAPDSVSMPTFPFVSTHAALSVQPLPLNPYVRAHPFGSCACHSPSSFGASLPPSEPPHAATSNPNPRMNLVMTVKSSRVSAPGQLSKQADTEAQRNHPFRQPHPQDTTAPGYDPRVAMLQCGLAWERDARLIGNVTAADVAKVAALTMTQCPACGSEAWVNIDCGVCVVVGELVADVKKAGAA